MVAALHSSKSVEWYTHPDTVLIAREALGGVIDLDPASCEIANRIVQADVYFTREDDGLAHEWAGHVFCNPPYGARITSLWVDKMIHECRVGNIKAGVLLVNATPDRRWFHKLWEFPICFAYKRMRAWNPEHEKNSPTHGHVLVYFGQEPWVFAEACEDYGRVVPPVRWEAHYAHAA